MRHQDDAPSDARDRYSDFLKREGGLAAWRECESMGEATELADRAGVKDVFLEALKIGR